MSKQNSSRIDFKFCGGCNPLYDRNSVYLCIKRHIDEELVKEMTGTILIILNGCRAECIKATEFKGVYDKIINTKDFLVAKDLNSNSKDICDWIINQII